MRIDSKVRRTMSFAVVGIAVTLILFCLGTVLIALIFPVPPTLLIFSPPPPKVLGFSQVDEIIINDSWMGLALFPSYDNQYTLKKHQSQFNGDANFSVGMFDPIHATAPLAVSGDEIKKFTDLLAQTKPERGVYTPKIDHTDDYPKIEIVLKYQNNEIAKFSSISQGETHIPWIVTINGDSYIVESEHPAKALEELKKNLRQDVLESLIDQVE